MKRQPSIRTVSLTTGYSNKSQRKTVTSGLDAELYGGRLVCLLGPNGAGKSTLLRTLAGFQPPLGGEVWIMGRPLRSYAPKELARCMSVVLTEKPVLENMKVENLVELGRTPYTDFWGRLDAEDKEAVERAVELTGIGSLRNRYVQTLSDGERQKVMIAKAFAQETPIIFLDEPTAFLDYPSKVEIMLLLYSLAHKFEKTIFMSTHDLDLALQLSDIIWLIDKKLGITIGDHKELTASGALESYFIRPGIRFDRADGLFKIDFSYRNKISGIIG